MANYVHKNTVSKLVKDMQQTAKFMTDMEGFFTSQWKKGAGINEEVRAYVDRKQVETLVDGYQKMANAIEALAGNVEQLLNMQAKQSVDMFKVARTGKLNAMNVVEEVTAESHIADLEGIKLLDPELYTKGSRIVWNTFGLVPRDIAFNEFDIERMNDPDFDVFNQDHIKDRWLTLAQQCRAITGMSLGELLKAYAVKRGLEFTAKKRGRKSQSEVQA